VRWEDVNAYECGNCRGNFLPGPALNAFFESHALTHRFERLVRNVRAAPESLRNLSCAHCMASSFRTLSAGIVELDACASCSSIYFDAHEATRYFRQARFKAGGRKGIETGVDTLDGASTIIEVLYGMLP
jgi:Zn-finger nucleic acid-binding protein